MIHEKTKAMVEMFKKNWTAFGGLSKEEQEFFFKNIKQFGVLQENGTVTGFGWLFSYNKTKIYRLSPDFVLPEEKKRWFYYAKEQLLINNADYPNAPLIVRCIEVHAEDVEYVKERIEQHKAGEVNLDEFEFRHVRAGDSFITQCGEIRWSCGTGTTLMMRFIRKQPAEVKPSGYVDGFVMLSGVEVPCKVRVKEESK